MHRADIKAALQKKGLTLVQVSLAAGLSKSACGYALAKPSLRAEAALATALKVTPQDLWPERHDADGTRRVRRRASSARRARAGQ